MSLSVAMSLGVGLAEAACFAPATTADVAAAIDDAEGRYAAVDVEGFLAATERAFERLPCVSDRVPRPLAAEVHRVRGLRAFVDRDVETARLAFAAARRLEPDYVFPDALVPPGNPIRLEYDASLPKELPTVAVPLPRAGYVEFDGQPTNERPSSTPTIAQLIGANGAIVETAYLLPADPMLTYTAADPGTAVVPLVAVQPPPKRRPNVVVLASAGGLAGVGAVMYGAAAAGQARYLDADDPITDRDELEALAGRTNGLAATSYAFGIASVALGAVAFVVEF